MATSTRASRACAQDENSGRCWLLWSEPAERVLGGWQVAGGLVRDTDAAQRRGRPATARRPRRPALPLAGRRHRPGDRPVHRSRSPTPSGRRLRLEGVADGIADQVVGNDELERRARAESRYKEALTLFEQVGDARGVAYPPTAADMAANQFCPDLGPKPWPWFTTPAARSRTARGALPALLRQG
jgi:hypothetical protein